MYKIKGRVTDEVGNPLGGLFVDAYDKDVLADDYLGNAYTDSQGEFEITFGDVAFKGMGEWLERRADEYLVVRDESRTLHRTKVRKEAKDEEFFKVVIDSPIFDDPYANAFQRMIASFSDLLGTIDPDPRRLDLPTLIPQMIRTLQGIFVYTSPKAMQALNYPGPLVPKYPKGEEHAHTIPWYPHDHDDDHDDHPSHSGE